MGSDPLSDSPVFVLDNLKKSLSRCFWHLLYLDQITIYFEHFCPIMPSVFCRKSHSILKAYCNTLSFKIKSNYFVSSLVVLIASFNKSSYMDIAAKAPLAEANIA